MEENKLGVANMKISQLFSFSLIFKLNSMEVILDFINKNHCYDLDKTESPIERFLLTHIVKFLKKDTQLLIQYPIKTISGNFRADIALKRNNKTLILECDGKEHHSTELDDWYDEWRDSLILMHRNADVIYRVKGGDIFNSIYTLFDIIHNYDPDFFESDIINRIIRNEIYDDEVCRKTVEITFENESGDQIPYKIEVKRKDLKADFDSFWLKYILYSLLYRDRDIFELIEIMKAKSYNSKTLVNMINLKYPEVNLQDEMQLLKMRLPQI